MRNIYQIMRKISYNKVLVVLLTVFMTLTFVGCNQNDSGMTSSTEINTEAVVSTEDMTTESASSFEESTSEEDTYLSVEDVEDNGLNYDRFTMKEDEEELDQYQTSKVPDGKPKPVEPQDTTIDKNKALTCTLMIECSTILKNMDDLEKGKESLVPSDGVLMKKKTVTFYEGESVFDVLKRETRNQKIHMEYSFTPVYNSSYVEGIGNLYEFDCGELSGWMYSVNGWYPNYGCSRYQLKQGDVIEWHYTCDLGNDLK